MTTSPNTQDDLPPPLPPPLPKASGGTTTTPAGRTLRFTLPTVKDPLLSQLVIVALAAAAAGIGATFTVRAIVQAILGEGNGSAWLGGIAALWPIPALFFMYAAANPSGAARIFFIGIAGLIFRLYRNQWSFLQFDPQTFFAGIELAVVAALSWGALGAVVCKRYQRYVSHNRSTP